MAIPRLVLEDIAEFPANQMTYVKTNNLKSIMCVELPNYAQLIIQTTRKVYRMAQSL